MKNIKGIVILVLAVIAIIIARICIANSKYGSFMLLINDGEVMTKFLVFVIIIMMVVMLYIFNKRRKNNELNGL